MNGRRRHSDDSFRLNERHFAPNQDPACASRYRLAQRNRD
jgi:hypothetical protein